MAFGETLLISRGEPYFYSRRKYKSRKKRKIKTNKRERKSRRFKKTTTTKN